MVDLLSSESSVCCIIVKVVRVKKYLVVVLLLLPLLLSGCIKFENIELISVKDVTYKEFKDNVLQVAITATINNPNRIKVKIKDANMDLRLGDKVIGTVTQVEQVELAGGTQKDYKIQISIEMKDMVANLIALYRTLMNESSKLNLSGSLHVKSFLYSKTIKVDNLSFK